MIPLRNSPSGINHEHVRPHRRPGVARRSGRQRGVVLFVALIGMVVLSLAAVALLRSVDSGTSIAGNLAFKQASIGPINYAIEQANYALFDAPAASRITDPFNHARRVQLLRQPAAGRDRPPAFRPASTATATRTRRASPYTRTRRPVTRCAGSSSACARVPRSAPGRVLRRPAGSAGIQACDLLVPKVSPAGTTMELCDQGKFCDVPPQPLYRVTVRVDGPSNTVTYAQAMLR